MQAQCELERITTRLKGSQLWFECCDMSEDTELVMSNMKMGVNVDIKRSDGRIHSAVISGINYDTKGSKPQFLQF